MSTTPNSAEWIGIPEALRRLAIGRPALMALIINGRLTTRLVPGSTTKLLAAEVDELAEKSTRRAVVSC